MSWIVNKIINKFTFHPHNKVVLETINIPDYVNEEWISTKDGETLQAFYFRHYENNNYPLVIYFHGNTGNIYSHNRFEYAQRLYEMKQNVLIVSYRGYSKSTGTPSEKGIYIDGISTAKYAKTVLGFEERNITVIGRSLGTVVAIHIAQKRNYKGLILITPLSNGKDMASVLGFKWVSFLANNVLKSTRKIKKVTCKKLIIAGDIDKQTPLDMALKLYQSANKPKKLVVINGGGHNNLQYVNPDLFWGEIDSFLNT
jgi:fermentation-respiration switch protein FrsA (DUF1100 family)